MKLSISNLAWNKSEEEKIAKLLDSMGIKFIEIAPSKIWKDPLNVSSIEIKKYIDFWKTFGIQIISLQSLLFNRPDLEIFKSSDNTSETIDYLKKVINLAHQLGARDIVFGSPINRNIYNFDIEKLDSISIKFFNELAVYSSKFNINFCIEPNSTKYSCNFITNTFEGIQLVNKVNKSNFGLNLDTGNMIMDNENIYESITKSKDYIKHFHISAPYLDIVDKGTKQYHLEASRALKDINYDGYISIEMKASDNSNIDRIKKSIEYVRNLYF